ncbi:hypothetical protein [Microbispora bryophytorum]|uniref:Ig-like domain-containing protein n=1 Tax=Microbispora bryophytorum TaxID=1460882 RepID=A0A8H9GV47_9ACTN|nr:hypothetical protein [Microbispora bryophytorum]MBD3138813.1 hypothetical protein [Microbispora bryophytorum]TQS10079.1 hypothetical protein FLX07_03375 [Microbispora bryophytorum]GGO00332.1 hypothetical protein GCM10011574_06970 [Microbispora bryophytorum]
MRKLTRTGAITAMAAAALTVLVAPAFAEETVVMTNSTSVGPGISAYVSVQCPSTKPYPVSTRTSSIIQDTYDGPLLNFTGITVNGRQVKVSFSNSQSKSDPHGTRVSVKIEVLCSNVQHEPMTGFEFMQSTKMPPGGEALLTVACPPTHPRLTGVDERHPAKVSITSVHPEEHSYSVWYQNDDFMAENWAELWATCSA